MKIPTPSQNNSTGAVEVIRARSKTCENGIAKQVLEVNVLGKRVKQIGKLSGKRIAERAGGPREIGYSLNVLILFFKTEIIHL